MTIQLQKATVKSNTATGLIFAVIFFLAGCAAQVPLMNTAEDRWAKTDTIPADKAAVYVFRESTFCAQKQLFSVAVDGLIVGWNANNTYYKLLLSPGSHELEAFAILEGWERTAIVSESKLALNLVAGNSYYVSQKYCFSDELLREVKNAEGMKALTSMQLARFDSRNLATSKAKQMVKDGIPLNIIAGLAPTPTTNTRPSVSSEELKATFSSILEGVGLALLIGLAVYGAAHSGSYAPSTPVHNPLLDRPAYVQPAVPQQTANPSSSTYLSTSGDIYNVSGNTIYSPTKGERWTINGNTIRGTNGSSYRISGDTIYSETGQSFRQSGSTLLGSDGSICSITGTLINCK